MRVIPKAFITISCLGAVAACGVKDQDKAAVAAGKQDIVLDADTSALTDDEELAGDHIATVVDDAISDLLEGDETTNQAGAFALSDIGLVGNTASATRYRACAPDDSGKNAVVTLKRGIERSTSITKNFRTGETSFKNLTTETRTWSKPDSVVACASNGKYADITRAGLEGINLKVAFKGERSRSSSYENSKRNTSVSSSYAATIEGTRQVKWTSVQTQAGKLILEKEVQADVERSITSTNAKGVSRSLQASMKTASDAPLALLVERDASSDELISRTIVSGKKITTTKTGSRLETSFSNVKYTPDSSCYATTGKITGLIFAKSTVDAATDPADLKADQAAASFVIDFSEDGKTVTITKADGSTSEIDYMADGCPIETESVENTTGATTDVSSADDVKIAE